MDTQSSLGEAAQLLGHSVEVESAGKRFRLVCSCGYATQTNWTRKLAFERLKEHLAAVVAAPAWGAETSGYVEPD